MNLHHAPDYSTRIVTPQTPDAAPMSELMVAGVPAGTSSLARCLKQRCGGKNMYYSS